MKSPINHRRSRTALAATATLACTCGAQAQDTSRPAVLQFFESTYAQQADAAGDLRALGYGAVWIPPTGRADLTDFSVGYDVFDRFDLGSVQRPTLYGTERGLRALTGAYDRAGLDVHADLIWNHAGFSDRLTPGFAQSGGYPGLLITAADRGFPDGDFHPRGATGDLRFRLSGLVDLDQDVGISVIRQPTDAGDPRNIRPGVRPDAFGRINNLPDPANARFYPGGVAVPETSTQYLQRNARWLVEEIGIDGFRLDAVKHFRPEHLQNLDAALADANPRLRLDGSRAPVFTYGEVLDGNRSFVQQYVNTAASRTALDYPQFFALRDNLTRNGLQNDWRSVVDAGMDVIDDGLHNGSSGVLFADNHDVDDADKIQLTDTAHAYILTQPGDAVVYLNARQHGDNRDFPSGSRTDALDAGSTLGRLLSIRNSHGRGDYRNRLTEKETFVMERSGSMLVALSNRGDAGFDARTVDSDFTPGTLLVELTGNAAQDGNIPTVATADGNGRVALRVRRGGSAPGGDAGQLVYGLATPQSANGLELSGASGDGLPEIGGAAVVTGDSLTATLRTQAVTVDGTVLSGGQLVPVRQRDRAADGDNALLRLDAGVDLNGSGDVDNTAPGSPAYGFESFTLSRSGFDAADGNGLYRQVIDTAGLAEGEHYLTARAFRAGDPNRVSNPAVFSDFHRRVLVDRVAAEVALDGVIGLGGQGNDFTAVLINDDDTASAVHRFFNLPASFTDAQILGLLNNGTRANDLGAGQFAAEGYNLLSGNHTLTTVTEEATGRQTVQRFTGIAIASSLGAGIGDLDGDGAVEAADLTGSAFAFDALLASDNTRFSAAADATGDGLIDTRDLLGLRAFIRASGDAGTEAAYATLLTRRADLNGDGTTDSRDIDTLFSRRGTADAAADLNVDGTVDDVDATVLIQSLLLTGAGDANLDRAINLADFAAIAAAFGQSPTRYASGDFNGDGTTNLGDFALLGRGFGLTFGDTASGAGVFVALEKATAIPEPTGLLAAGIAGTIILRRRR